MKDVIILKVVMLAILFCQFSDVFADFPPRNPSMAIIFAGRMLQNKYYQRFSDVASEKKLVASNNAGVYFNPFYTPFWKVKIPVDILLGYEFTMSDEKIVLESASQQLKHIYYCSYLSGCLSLNLLHFMDFSLYGGYGLASDNFTHNLLNSQYDYSNKHMQTYLMPGVEFFFVFGRRDIFLKLGIYMKKELTKAWDLNAVSIGNFHMIDHSTAQFGARLILGYGRGKKRAPRRKQIFNIHQ